MRGPRAQTQSAGAPAREAFETLAAAESDTLEAMVARIIPTDENGPGAAKARAAHNEVPNLGIPGGSVMGTSGARNPTLTIQALSWRTAERFAQNWKSIVV